MKNLRIFLLGNIEHPEDLAAMSAEKDYIEREHSNIHVVAPSELRCVGFLVQVVVEPDLIQTHRDREFHEDLYEMLTCDGVILMEPVESMTAHTALMYAVARRAAMRMSNNTGDLINRLKRTPGQHLSWRPKHITEIPGYGQN